LPIGIKKLQKKGVKMKKAKRGRPCGSQNKKRRGRGRPRGSRGRLNTNRSDVKILQVGLTCKKCKRYYIIRVSREKDLVLYTPELKKNYVCVLCK